MSSSSAYDELSGAKHEPVQRRLRGDGLEAGAHVVDQAPRRVGGGEVRADGERAAAARLDDRHDLARQVAAAAVVHGGTVAPRAPSARATARPIPRDAPVTRKTRP